MKTLGFKLGWLLASNNGRCALLWALTIIMFLFSVFYGAGEPLLTRTIDQQLSRVAQIDRPSDSWWNTDKSLAKTSWSKLAPSQQTSTKSWWPWLATALLLVLAIVYTPKAYKEEILSAGHEAWELLRARTETGEAKKESGEVKQVGVSVVEKISQQVGWKRLLSMDMISQLAGNFVQRWLFRRR